MYTEFHSLPIIININLTSLCIHQCLHNHRNKFWGKRLVSFCKKSKTGVEYLYYQPIKLKELEAIGFLTISQILLRCTAWWSKMYLHSLYPCLTNSNLLSLAKSNLVLKKTTAVFFLVKVALILILQCWVESRSTHNSRKVAFFPWYFCGYCMST